jgi:WD40 repeat protein
MLATMAGLLLLIAVGSWLLTLRLNQTLQQTQEEKRKADENLWVALLEQARGKSRSREPGQRFQGLAAIRQALRLPVPPGHSLAELRNEAIACLALPDVEPAGEWWEGWPNDTFGIACDATFERYARPDKDGNVSLRRVADDAQLILLKGWGPPTWDGLSFSPDGQFLYHRCAPDGRFKVYRLNGPGAEVVLEDTSGPELEQAVFSPDGRFLATCHCSDRSVAVYDLHSARKDKDKRLLPTGGLRPDRLAFRPGQPHLAVAGETVVRVLDLKEGKAVAPDLTTRVGISWLAWHPEGRTLATTGYDLQILLWDVAAGKLSLPPLAGHSNGGVVAAFNPAGDCLLSNDWSNDLRLWDPRTGRQLLQTQSGSQVFSRDGELLAPDVSGARVRLLRVATRRPLRSLAPLGDSGERELPDAQLSPDGRLLLVTKKNALALLDWASGQELASIPGLYTWVLRFDSREGLLTGGRDGGLLRWPVRAEPETGRLHVGPPETLVDARIVLPPGCSADGRVIALPGFNGGAVVLHWPENRRVSLGPREDVRHCAVSPDGRWVATGDHSNLQGIGATVWDAASGQAVKDFPVGRGCKVGFSPDDRWLLTTGNRFRLWNVGSWEEGPPLAQPDTVGYHFAFSPDGQVLALVGGFNQVWLIDVDSGAEIARLTVPEQTRVTPRCFSPDGSQLVAVGTESNLLYIWDLRALRAQLNELGLDWYRDYPPAQPSQAWGEVRMHLGQP